ncbi:Gamma-zein like [Heracleum sosnowskyi]|uniref:Gamma-zein like n=1 Tax=Heracleum sosnowskyi TaxID=360622 RepID=A0AAD8H9R7_9APIA|nr:Gamma-zein like [Heracleum sosnowskyi]
MEKFSNSSDKEYMKMAMLKHEEMFREQVYELHRLYRVQKLLMNNISRNKENEMKTRQDRWIKSKDENNSFYYNHSHHIHQQPRQKLDLEQPVNVDRNGGLQIEDECDIELTLGPSSYNPTMKAKTPLTSDSGLSFSSSSTGSSSVKRRDNSDGLRRITGKTMNKELTAHNWGLVEVPTSSPSFMNGRKISTNDNEQLRQDRLQQPPWLFQVLSMNIT